jgi:diaminopimelate epimerase
MEAKPGVERLGDRGAYIPFTKMSGSGNDFVVIDHRERLLPDDKIPAFARAVCRRRLSVGADGVILIEAPTRSDTDFRWRYFNADGSVGEMCGNGAMCGARFAVEEGIASHACRFETEAGVVQAEVGGGNRPQVVLALEPVTAPVVSESITIGPDSWEATRILVGVPHMVTVVADVDAWTHQTFDRWGRDARYHPAYAPLGTNANLIHRLDDHTIRMRTWERGVEAETLACGTGAVASSIVAARQGLVSAPVRVMVSSGEVLQVSFRNVGDRIDEIRLAGRPRIVMTGAIAPEAVT